MKILITGGNGLLGYALKNAVKSRPNDEFIFVNNRFLDLANEHRAYMLYGTHKPEVVIHCAAKVGGIKINKEKPETMFHENILMNAHMVHHAAKNNVRLIAFGSTCSFSPEVRQFDELNINWGEPYKSNYAYGYAKRMLHIQLEAAREQYGLNYTYVIPTTLFGENDNFSLDNGHVLPSIIHKCHINPELRMWGDGSPRRQLLYSQDAAQMVLNLIDKEERVVFLGSPYELSILEMATSVREKMEFKGKTIWEADKPNGQLKRPLVPANPDHDYVPFDKALANTCKWFKENYPNVRK